MALVFFPPVRNDGPRYSPQDHPSVKAVRGRCAPVPIGTNVWQKNDDTFTTTQPADSDIKRWFKGGSYNEVDEEEAALLTAAGYTITERG